MEVGGYTPSIKRQSVNTSVKPRDSAICERQIECQEASGECQVDGEVESGGDES